MKSPVVLIAFNRPGLTQRVLDRIRMVQPQRLFLVVDGPRPHCSDDKAKCQDVRKVLERIEWSCEVSRNYADENLGCFERIVSGLFWVFGHVDRAIIIEDDILPDVSFFRYCDELLERYCDDERISMISGHNLLGKWENPGESYHFSHTDGIWGWATWRRAWQHYDPSMSLWPNERVRGLLRDCYPSETTWRYRYVSFDRHYGEIQRGEATTWDLIWNYTQLLYSGLCIAPSVNMIENLGMNVDPTHGGRGGTKYLVVPVYQMPFPLLHPEIIMADHEYDRRKLGRLMSGDRLEWMGALAATLRYIYWRYLRLLVARLRGMRT